MILKTFEKNPRHLSEEDIRELSEKVQPYLTGKRYAHTMAVAEEAARLGAIFGFSEDDRNRLRASALMHDITKLADSKKQLQYCEEFGIIIEPEKMFRQAFFTGSRVPHSPRVISRIMRMRISFPGSGGIRPDDTA